MADHDTKAASTRSEAGGQHAHPADSVRAMLSSAQTQEAFLQHIADQLGRDRVTEKPQHPFRGVPDFWREYTLTKEECITTFMNNWTALGGHAFRLQSMAEVKGFLQEFIEETGAESICCKISRSWQSLSYQRPSRERTWSYGRKTATRSSC